VLNCAVAVYDKKAVVAVGARPLKTEVVEGSADDKLSQTVAGILRFGSNMRGSAEYRKKLCEVLVKRALAKTGCEQ
jgi:CO/xanthine dehydrogenase FAD-binding subunit